MSKRFMGAARSRGFALVAALFLMVVVAALGTFAIRVHTSQQGSADLDLAGIRAEAALQAGIQYAAARLLLPANGCGDVSNQIPLPHGFTVTFTNCQALPVANTPAVTVFSVTATATRGQYGSPEFVSRRRTVRITTP